MTADDAGSQAPFTRATPRLFIAVPLAESARAEVEALVEVVRAQLRSTQPSNPRSDAERSNDRRPGSQADGRTARRTEVRWVRMDGLHLTLRFLGPTPPDHVERLASAVDAAAAEQRPFDVEINGGGAFPSATKPRTLWLGITQGQDELIALAEAVAVQLEVSGWPPEARPFRGHLTLGRSDGRLDGRATVRLLTERAERFRTRFRADRLVLFESVTGGGPARYVPVHEVRLSG
jgi:2'-5' RNA ligase